MKRKPFTKREFNCEIYDPYSRDSHFFYRLNFIEIAKKINRCPEALRLRIKAHDKKGYQDGLIKKPLKICFQEVLREGKIIKPAVAVFLQEI